MNQNIEGLNKKCGRKECLVSDPWLCLGCLGDESNDDYYEKYGEEK